MSSEKEKTAENSKNAEETQKNWMELISEFVKNPVATLGMGGLGGFLISQHLAGKEIERLKEKHREELEQKDEQINKLISHSQKMNERLETTLRGLLGTEKENTEELDQDPVDKVYRPKKKQFRLK